MKWQASLRRLRQVGLGNGHGAFEQMYEAFWEFRSLFVPLFGRRESRDHRQNYLRAFLVHSQDRRNAENFTESN